VIPNLRLIREPIEALRDWSAEFGHTFTVDRLGVPTVMTADPELIGEIYGARDPELFDAVVPGSLDVLLGSNSLLMLSGRRHQHERKLMTPPFHGERMRGWAGAMAEAARRAFAGSGEIRAAERTQEATLEVIVRVVFGVQDETRVAEFMAAINACGLASCSFARCSTTSSACRRSLATVARSSASTPYCSTRSPAHVHGRAAVTCCRASSRRATTTAARWTT
jgi:cytochrome P450